MTEPWVRDLAVTALASQLNEGVPKEDHPLPVIGAVYYTSLVNYMSMVHLAEPCAPGRITAEGRCPFDGCPQEKSLPPQHKYDQSDGITP